MRPPSKSDPRQLTALQFDSEADEDRVLDELTARDSTIEYSLVADHTIILPKDARSLIEDICRKLTIKMRETSVIEPAAVPPEELAKERAQRFRVRPSRETRQGLARALEKKKRA